MYIPRLLILLGCIFAISLAQTAVPGHGPFEGYLVVHPRTSNEIIDIDAREYDHHEIVPGIGVSRECLIIMDNIAWQVNTNGYNSRCPNGNTFGALVVNFSDTTGSVKDNQGRSCGRILSTNRGPKTKTDPTEHAENDAIRRLAYENKGERSNAPFWAHLGMFTPGASCPMDTAAEIWTGFGWQIYSLSIADLIKLNYTQIDVEPEVLMRKVATITTSHYGLVRYVNREANVPRFGYRFIPANPCPAGCSRNAASICTDDTPYTATPIPDVDYIHVDHDFVLQYNPIWPADPANTDESTSP